MERLGRYELVARLAQGGMGEIYLARLEGAEGFAKLYAVKRILPQFASDGRFRKMLIGEAQIASKMSHSNICQVYELGEEGGQLFIVMEYLEGVTLLPLLRARSKQQHPLELAFVAAVLLQICDGLHYAHELRDRDGHSLDVIHRDVTLANVFVCESGTAKVLDFGLAKVKDAQGTQTGTVKGKYAYMAPEQLRGETITRRVDVFALGVVAYEMLALRRLFQRQTDYLTFHAVLEQPIADIRRYRPDLPDAVVAVVMRALDRDPEKRFPTVRALGSALADSLGQLRPWPNEQVGGLVLDLFTRESAERQQAVARALDKPGSMLEAAPIASNISEQDDDEDGFPAVETEVGPVSNDVRTVVERMASRGLPSGTSPEAVIMPTTETAVVPARSPPWIWLVLILVVLAAGGVAVAFVIQQQPTKTEIIVEQSDAQTREKDMKAVLPHTGALMACAAKHATKEANASAHMLISANGSLDSVRFEPDEIDRGLLGKCLRDVLQAVVFEKRNASTGFHLDLVLPASTH